MLVAKPVRLRNLVATTIGKNLIKVGDVYRWTFEAVETKTAEVIDALLPQRLTPYIDRWIGHHRRLLLGPTASDALWISIKGKAMGRAAVYERVCIVTKEELGIRINPHAFRHIVATGVAIAIPEEVRLTPFLLDHRTERTVQEHYNLADSLSASSRYLQRLEIRRRQALDGNTPKE
jgi:integrase/recombinase XerD